MSFLFRTPFILFLIVAVSAFSVSVRIAEASIFSWLWTAIALVVTVLAVVLTGGAALAFLGICPICGAVTSFGGLSAASITTGVACGTGLICGGSSVNPVGIIINAPGSCATDNGMRFYDSDPGSASPDDQIALYRFASGSVWPNDPDQRIKNFKIAEFMTGLTGWNTRQPLGSGFYDAGPTTASAQYAHLADAGGRNCAYHSPKNTSGCADFYPPVRPNRAFVENDTGTYAQYLDYAPPDGAPLRLLRYGDVCTANGECKILDQSAPAGNYIIYAAKLLRAFPNVTPAGGGAPTTLANKFLTVTQGAPATFPLFPFYLYEECIDNAGGGHKDDCRRATGPFYQGTIFAGPFLVGNAASCPVPVTPSAVINASQTGCNFATLSVTPYNADTYDMARDGITIASGIPADQVVYNDSGLNGEQTYTYSVVAYRGGVSGSSNILSVATPSCASAPTATITLLQQQQQQCTTLKLGITTQGATKYHVFRDGAPIASDIPASQTEFIDSGLDRNTAYTYVVRAVNGAQSADSAPLSASTPDCGADPVASIAFSGVAECNAVTLSVTAQNAATYDVLRNGATIAAGIPASQISYHDAPLQHATDYAYSIVAHGTFGRTATSNTLNAHTTCLPQCSFVANPTSIVKGETSRLSWNCVNADSCALGSGSVADSGAKTVAPTRQTIYTLTCQNADGSIGPTATVTVSTPGFREVAP